MNETHKIKFDWYQTDTHVMINIYEKRLQKDEIEVEITDIAVGIVVKLPTQNCCLNFRLCCPVVPSESYHRILATKVEVKLKKREAVRWPSLEGDGIPALLTAPNMVSNSAAPLKYPSSAPNSRDWNAIGAQVAKEEEDEKPEGDEALNRMFQKIYGDGSDDVKRAMKKSFVQSGGTVLSTNWNEVSQKDVEVKSPDGMEWRTWNN